MKETGIIMSSNHPKLILDLEKTKTRRVIKFKPPVNQYGREWASPFLAQPYWVFTAGFGISTTQLRIKCPYGQVGDKLWVREAWRILDDTMVLDDEVRVEYKADGQVIKRRYGDINYNEGGFYLPVIQSAMKDGKWKPAHHLPHIISRITLEITDLWVELLRSISPADALAEGGYTVEEFIKLYLKINHLLDDADPWNWAIKYKLLGVGD